MGVKKVLKRIKKAIKRRLDFSTEGRRQKVIAHPPEVKKDTIVMVSYPDFTGNPKALFQYMIEHGYNEKYQITWLFNKRENYFEFDLPNVSSMNIKNEQGERTPEAQKAIMSTRYVIYSHNVNWCKKYRDEQSFINLWHGSAYKGPHQGDKVIYFDYMMVTGKKFIDVFKDYMKHKDGTFVDLGYPRNEYLFTNKSGAHEYLNTMKTSRGAETSIIWMPTFRKSTLKRLDSDTNLGDTGLPILYDQAKIEEIDAVCKANKTLLIIKQHPMQINYGVDEDKLSNIVFLTEKDLYEKGIESYEMIGATDAMISDYSSAAIDYMLIDKPIGYTLDDFDKYEDIRGWAFDGIKYYMPGHHMYKLNDMVQFIEDITAGKDPHKEWRAKVTEEFHTYKNGFSERILKYFDI